MGHLNIISFRNKLVFVENIIKLFDVFLVSQSKLEHTFPSNYRLESTVTKSLDLTVIVLEMN